MSKAGLSYANYNGFAFIAAHLYNAVRQLGLLTKVWPEMEEYIRMHVGTLFFGKLTTNPKDFANHYSYKMGLLPSSVRALIQSDRFNSQFRPGWKDGPQLPPDPIISILQDVYDDTANSNMLQFLSKLQTVFQQSSAPQKPKSKAARQQPQLSPLEFLRLLRTSLPSTIQDLQYDYFSWTRTCKDLLKRLRSTLVCDLGIDYGELVGQEVGHGPGGTGYFLIAFEILASGEMAEKYKELPEAQLLQVVAKRFEKYINGRTVS